MTAGQEGSDGKHCKGRQHKGRRHVWAADVDSMIDGRGQGPFAFCSAAARGRGSWMGMMPGGPFGHPMMMQGSCDPQFMYPPHMMMMTGTMRQMVAGCGGPGLSTTPCGIPGARMRDFGRYGGCRGGRGRHFGRHLLHMLHSEDDDDEVHPTFVFESDSGKEQDASDIEAGGDATEPSDMEDAAGEQGDGVEDKNGGKGRPGVPKGRHGVCLAMRLAMHPHFQMEFAFERQRLLRQLTRRLHWKAVQHHERHMGEVRARRQRQHQGKDGNMAGEGHHEDKTALQNGADMLENIVNIM